MNMSLKKQLSLMAAIAIVSVLLLGFFSWLMAKNSSIGSEKYLNIIHANELTADVLPPPLFMVESMMKVEALSSADAATRSNLIREIKNHFKDYDVRVDRWKNSNDAPQEIKQAITGKLDSASQEFIDVITQQVIPAASAANSDALAQALIAARESFAKHREVVDQLVVLANNYVQKQAESGKSSVEKYKSLLMIVAFISIGLVVLASVFFSRLILNRLGTDPADLQRVASAITAGNYNVELESKGDAASVAAAVSSMVDSIKSNLAQASHNHRIRNALDVTSSNVMIADVSRTIIYMNKAVEKMLRIAESDLRKALPHFSVDKVVGSNMDIFHKNPAHQSTLLENLRGTYVGNIVVAGRSFRLIANPIFDEKGERLGSVVEWLDRTDEVAVEKEVSHLVESAAAGDFSTRIAVESKEGFFLKLAEGLNQLVNTADKGLNDVARVLGAISKGDLTEKINAEYSGTFGDLKNYCNETTENLTSMLSDIRNAVETIFTASTEIAQGNADLSSRTEQQAANLEETASSMEELTSTVKLNADNAKQANVLAEQASSVATDGGSLIQQVVVTMDDINQSAKKISDIIGVIDGIAFQTNILALNAAVEAARAGDQGRGFAVVASEVRTLAQRSANAAKDIKSLISDSVQKIESGNSLVNKSGETMKEIVNSIKRVNDIMSEIAAASNEQSTGIEEVSTAVSQMDEMTQQNAALVEEAAAAAESLQSQADQLNRSVGQFRLSAESESVNSVRAAPRISHSSSVNVPAKQSAPKKTSTKKLSPPKSNADDEWESF